MHWGQAAVDVDLQVCMHVPLLHLMSLFALQFQLGMHVCTSVAGVLLFWHLSLSESMQHGDIDGQRGSRSLLPFHPCSIGDVGKV